MSTIDAETASKLAGLQIDLLQKVRKEHVTLTHLEWFLNLSKIQRDMVSGADLSALTQREEISLRSLGPTLTILAKPECVVANCFTDKKVFAYRDSDFDNREWLPETLPASGAVKITGYELTRVTTEEAMAKVGGTFTNLLQIEDLILRTEKGENTDFITNGYANICFLQIGNSVFAVRAGRLAGGWFVCLRRFLPGREWGTGHRFFSPAT